MLVNTSEGSLVISSLLTESYFKIRLGYGAVIFESTIYCFHLFNRNRNFTVQFKRKTSK